jgi:hypothetical protein
MSDERKRQPVPRPEREPRPARLQGETDRQGQAEPQASPIERREWRGSGVCGDRHTD